MGRGRAPCCEKVGLNRGAWTPEEDMRLIAYIHKYGHGNWRALPKQAGLLRCGKSCRLRWINYLRPDIKRGNFSLEEEETIIKLHGLLGNKWSKIASSLPGRTDNEIKNVWNTHLKKRLKSNEQSSSSPTPTIIGKANCPEDTPSSSSSSSGTTSVSIEYKCSHPMSQHDTIDINEVLSLDKIEIPILPNLDVLDILDVDMEPKITALTDDIDDSIDEIIGIIGFEPEVWMNDVVTDTVATKEGDQVEEKRRWLAYLEEELGLFDDNSGGDDNDDDDDKMVEMVNVVGEEGDPVRSYFQKSHSSPSPM